MTPTFLGKRRGKDKLILDHTPSGCASEQADSAWEFGTSVGPNESGKVYPKLGIEATVITPETAFAGFGVCLVNEFYDSIEDWPKGFAKTNAIDFYNSGFCKSNIKLVKKKVL